MPVVVGVILGAEALGGLLAVHLSRFVLMAIFMSNAEEHGTMQRSILNQASTVAKVLRLIRCSQGHCGDPFRILQDFIKYFN